MADIKLFDISGAVQELSSKQAALEKDLQKLLEEKNNSADDEQKVEVDSLELTQKVV